MGLLQFSLLKINRSASFSPLLEISVLCSTLNSRLFKEEKNNPVRARTLRAESWRAQVLIWKGKE